MSQAKKKKKRGGLNLRNFQAAFVRRPVLTLHNVKQKILDVKSFLKG